MCKTGLMRCCQNYQLNVQPWVIVLCLQETKMKSKEARKYIFNCLEDMGQVSRQIDRQLEARKYIFQLSRGYGTGQLIERQIGKIVGSKKVFLQLSRGYGTGQQIDRQGRQIDSQKLGSISLTVQRIWDRLVERQIDRTDRQLDSQKLESISSTAKRIGYWLVDRHLT